MSTFDPFDPRSTPNADVPDDEVTRGLRARYAPPGTEYWEGLEGRIMAAVTASRAAVTDAAEWWQVLAGWTRAGIAAAAMAAVVGGAAALQARDAVRDVVYETVVDAPAVPLGRRAGDSLRAADELFWVDGLGRRGRHAPGEMLSPDSASAASARREATFRYVMPY